MALSVPYIKVPTATFRIYIHAMRTGKSGGISFDDGTLLKMPTAMASRKYLCTPLIPESWIGILSYQWDKRLVLFGRFFAPNFR